MIQPAAEPDRAVGELLQEPALPVGERGGPGLESQVEAPAPLDLQDEVQGRVPGRRYRQSSIPRVGEEGTAISRFCMRPAR